MNSVVYELEYPRQSSINWSYVAEKMVATFGVLAIMVIVSQHYILPVVIKCNNMRAWPIEDRLREFPCENPTALHRDYYRQS